MHNNSLDYSQVAETSVAKDDNSLPSWIRLLDSPPFTRNDVTGSKLEILVDDASQGERNHSILWYHSPVLNAPVTGYYNRNTDSNQSLHTVHLNQPVTGITQTPVTKDQRLPRTAEIPGTGNLQPRPGQWQSALDVSRSNQSFGMYPDSRRPQWQSALNVSSDSHLSRTRPPSVFPDGKAGQWLSSIEELSHGVKDHSKEQQLHVDTGVYNDLDSFSPWLNGWPVSKDQTISEKPGSHTDDLHHRDDLGLGEQSYHNYGYGGSMGGSLDALSAGRLEVHRPEEFLSGLQRAESDSVQYARAPCGRCTPLVTSLLIMMGLAVIALAAALAASIITKEPAESQALSQDGYPVVRASMALKILNKNFTSQMVDPSSAQFASVAAPYSIELDRLFLKSPLAKAYRGNKVISLGPGSIKTNTELLFLDNGVVQDEAAVQNVITSAERASQWAQSDAREVGDFVVCSDCVTVSLEHAMVRQLPLVPSLPEEGKASSTVAPPSEATTETNPSASVGTTSGASETTVNTPTILISATTPFLTDGHYVISCDVSNAADWSTVTLEFKSDNSSSDEHHLVLINRQSEVAQVAATQLHRIFAYPVMSSDSVNLVVNVTSVTCADRGDYVCKAMMENGGAAAPHKSTHKTRRTCEQANSKSQ